MSWLRKEAENIAIRAVYGGYNKQTIEDEIERVARAYAERAVREAQGTTERHLISASAFNRAECDRAVADALAAADEE